MLENNAEAMDLEQSDLDFSEDMFPDFEGQAEAVSLTGAEEYLEMAGQSSTAEFDAASQSDLMDLQGQPLDRYIGGVNPFRGDKTISTPQDFEEYKQDYLAYVYNELGMSEEANQIFAREEHSAQIKEDLRGLLRLYPDVQELPTEVIYGIEGGLMPSVAYQQYLIKQKDMELEQLRLGVRNESKALGSLKGDGVSSPDAFLEGLLGDY